MKTKTLPVICVLTATRAEYGLLRPLILRLAENPDFAIQLAVTGAHLSPEFGLTYQEIERDGLHIDEKIPILLSADTPAAVSKSMGLAMIGFADYFARKTPDLLVVLGDRYETLAVCCAAVNARIPIAHLYGGETTEGAVDEFFRHAITKMSLLHFTSTEAYRQRVIQMGEAPDRVFRVGALGVENALHTPLLSRDELAESLHFPLDTPYAVVTFHPVTLEQDSAELQTEALLAAVDAFPEMRFILTKANADTGGRIINQLMERHVQSRQNMLLVDSLGTQRYLSALAGAAFVLGNSSSGIVEAPSFGIPTVNIGDRQKGRIQAESVIDCVPAKKDILRAIRAAISPDAQARARRTKNPYGDGDTSSRIAGILESMTPLYMGNSLQKTFYTFEEKA